MPTINKSQPQRPWMPQRKAYARSQRHIYDSPEWKIIRAIVREDEPLCRYCLEQDMAVDTAEIDHITPINMGGQPFDRSNLQGLCKPCHEAKSRREAVIGRRGNKTS